MGDQLMSDTFAYSSELIKEIASFNGTLSEGLQGILKDAESIKSKIEAYPDWKGQQKEELMTFLTLLLKYNKDLVAKKDCPFTQYKKAFQDLSNHVEGYTGESQSYKELNKK